MTHPLFKYSFPAALVAGLGGFFVGNTIEHGEAASDRRVTPREAFLASDDGGVDYTKLARVCLAAADRRTSVRTDVQPSIVAAPNDPKVVETKQSLDQVMAISLERGVWSRGAGARAQILLRRLPESDVADFESLLRTTMERGDLRVGPGAWVPQAVN